MLGAVRRLVSGTRAIEDVDLNPPHRADAFTVDVTELEQRTSAAVAALRQLASDLGQQLGQPDADDLEALRTSMLRAATYGVAGAVPLSAAGTEAAHRQTLITQASSIDVRGREPRCAARCAGRPRGDAGGTPRPRACAAPHRVRQVLHRAAALCRRRTPPSSRSALAQQRRSAARRRVRRAHLVPAHRACARRRRAAQPRAHLFRGAGDGRETHAEHRAASVRRQASDGLGCRSMPEQRLPAGKLSLAVHADGRSIVSQPLAGLLIDEWVEVVPNATETTGDRVPVRSPERRATAGDSARRAAGPRAAVDGRGRCSRCCSKRSTSRASARSIRTRWTKSGITCPALVLRQSTRPATPFRPTSRTDQLR